MARFFFVLPLALLLLTAGPAAGEAKPFFVDATQSTGLDFVHWNAMTGDLYFPEMTGAGAAFFDYDGDGDLDVYLVQGALFEGAGGMEKTRNPYPGKGQPLDRLYRNDLPKDGKGPLRFTDVTEASGLKADGYGMGVAVGDVDGDGHPDLYVTNYGPDQLWRNRGDGTFENYTAKAGLSAPGWSSSAAFYDYDGDGDLDLYVVGYVHCDIHKKVECYATSSRLDYCGPDAFPPAADQLWRNRGDGTFEDVSAPTGVAGNPGPGLGLVSGDFDGDGRVDLYVANDGKPNFLWLSSEQGLTEDALLAGLAVNRLGRPEAGMGVDAGDYDNDGDDDLFVTHLDGESNTLYAAEAGGLFLDQTLKSGLEAPSLPFTSFGTAFLDFDNDGWLDLAVVSGAVKHQDELAQAGDPYPLGQANQLFHNVRGDGPKVRRFNDVSPQGGPAFTDLEVGRGLAMGDVDNDGDPDLLIANNNGPARLLLAQAPADRPWIGLRPVDTKGRLAVGARIALERKGAPTLWRRIARDGSYLSARDPRAHFGLGEGAQLTRVLVIWPDGTQEHFDPPNPGRYQELRQGTGQSEESAP